MQTGYFWGGAPTCVKMDSGQRKASEVELRPVGKEKSGHERDHQSETGVRSKICRVLEIATVVTMIFLVWVLFLLPVLFYHIGVRLMVVCETFR